MVKIITVQFEFEENEKYETLLNVLKYSAKVNMPHVKFLDIRIPPPEVKQLPGYRMLISNTYKLQKWVEELEKGNRGDKFVFLDADMLILNDFSEVFEKYKFDVAYTYRVSGRLPLNGGVMFARSTRKGKNFFKEYLEINNEMLNNVKFHLPWRKKYAGMNQAALGWMLEESRNNAKILALPCPMWNVCNEDWPNMLPDAYILHIKSRLRLMCLDQKPPSRDIKYLVDIWKHYHKRMLDDMSA
jgi:hypothetical protein